MRPYQTVFSYKFSKEQEMVRVNAWNTFDRGQHKSCMDLAEDYKEFLSSCKTERECVDRKAEN